jgi:hypothetical protein
MKKYYIIIFTFICLLLFIGLLKWFNYLVKNNYIVECFTQMQNINESSLTNHTVDLPLTTTVSCKNFCGPTARCAITGEQCFADIDCPGCQPQLPNLNNNQPTNANVPGENDAGKLTSGVTPQFSTLTTDIGTQSKLITKHKFSKPYMANFGINTWMNSYNSGVKEFEKRYKPQGLQFMPDYPYRYSLSGQFIEEGPLASNAYLK